MRPLLSLTCFITLFCSAGNAQNLISFPVGEYWQFPDARTLGLAGGGSVSNSSFGALLLNPAAMALHDPGLELTASTRARNLEERRSFPLFDRFEDINQLNTYVINDNLFWAFQGGALYSFANPPIPYLKSVAVGVFNEVDQEYRYVEEVRENVFPDDPLAFNTIQFRGKLTRISAGAAFQIKKLNLGFQAGLLTGDLEQAVSVTFVDDQGDNFSQTTQRSKNNTPLVGSIGAVYQATPYMNIGGHFRLPYTIEYAVTSVSAENESSSSESIKYPGQLTVGLEYRGQQALKARLNADFTYEWWSNTEASLFASSFISGAPTTTSLEDAIQIKAGIEHSNTRLMFSAGTGFRGKGWEVGAAGGVSKTNYLFPDLFDDQLYGGDRSNSEIDDVEEIYVFGMLTLKVGFH
jgi:hypothetical protein